MAIGNIGPLVGARFRVDRELAHGPDMRSLLVTDLRNGRPCVLRQLSVATAAPAEAQRFEGWIAILEKIGHPGLPRFIAAFFEGEGAERQRVLITSYHPGESLAHLVDKGRPLSEAQAVALLRRIVPVLEYLHSFEPPLVHRAIRASGIIVGPDGRPCLTDLDYAVPGQAAPATDFLSLGLAFIHGMTGEDPEVVQRDGSRERVRLGLDVSEGFAAVLARMVDPAPDRRYADVGELSADLARLAGGRGAAAQPSPRVAQPVRELEEPGPRRRARPLVLAGLLLALVAVAALAIWMRQRSQPPPSSSLLAPATVREQASAPAAVQEQASAPAVPLQPAPVTASPAEPTAPVATSAQPAAVAAAPAAVPAPTPATEPGRPPAVAAPVAAAAPVVVEGRLLLDGKPFTRADAPAPLFWFRNQGTKAEEKPQVDYAAGAFTVRGLPPGRYGMSVRVDLNPGNPNIFPGDLNAWSEFTVGGGPPLALEVPLRTVLHLLQPVDNGVVIRGWDTPCGAGNVSPARVIFAWEPLEPGARYEASVDRLVCGRGYASAGRVFTETTSEAWVKFDLPPSTEGECYSFRLTAQRSGRTVGIMATHGKTGLGWDYRFTVAGR